MSFRSITSLPECAHTRLGSYYAHPHSRVISSHKYIRRNQVIVSAQTPNPSCSRLRINGLSKGRYLGTASCPKNPPHGHQILPTDKSILPSSEAVHRDTLGTGAEPFTTDDGESKRELTVKTVRSALQKGFPRPVLDPWPQDWALTWEGYHDKLLRLRTGKHGNTKDVFQEQYELAKDFIANLTADTFAQKWRALATSDKARILPSLLIGSLVESGAQTLFVLSNLGPFSKNFSIRMQCLRQVHLTYPHELQPGSQQRKIFTQEIAKLRSPTAWQSARMSIGHLDTLLSWSDLKQCEVIITDFSEHYPYAGPESLLPMITSYTKHGKTEEALKLFKQLPSEWLLNPRPSVKEAYQHLLKRDQVTKFETGSQFKILPQILALGIQPDDGLHNAVLEAAIANGVPEVAWDLYHYLKSNKLEINARSHLVLLKDAFVRNNVGGVNEILTTVNEREDLIKDPYLLAYSMNIVRNICFFEHRLSAHESMTQIMELYDRAYNRTALCRLGILDSSQSPIKDSTLPDPGPGSLAFTIWSYILVQHSGKPVATLWNWIMHQISAGDQSIINAARLEIIYNGFILFHTRTPSSMIRALKVVQYMLDQRLCMPTARTWSILMCGFLRHGQVSQAESVLRMMRLRGLALEQLDEDYLPPGYSLKDMAKHVEATLNERSIPDDLEFIIAR